MYIQKNHNKILRAAFVLIRSLSAFYHSSCLLNCLSWVSTCTVGTSNQWETQNFKQTSCTPKRSM